MSTAWLNAYQFNPAILDDLPIEGRQSELQQILKALLPTPQGQGRSVLLIGEEGMGKTSLLASLEQILSKTQTHKTLALTLSNAISVQEFQAEIQEALAQQATQWIDDALLQVNTYLSQAEITWTKDQLVLFLTQYQLGALQNSDKWDADAITQKLFTSQSFFKKLKPGLKQICKHAADVLVNPWLNLGVQWQLPLTSSNPDLATFFKTLNQSLLHTNHALVILLDQWEETLGTNEEQTAFKKELTQIIKDYGEGRNSRLAFVIACQSEHQSQSLGATLYQTLKARILLSPLSSHVASQWLIQQFSHANLTVDPPIIEAILQICKGNPADLALYAAWIQRDCKQREQTHLELSEFDQRFALGSPDSLADIYFNQLLWLFNGQETDLFQALSPLLGSIHPVEPLDSFGQSVFQRLETLGYFHKTSKGLQWFHPRLLGHLRHKIQAQYRPPSSLKQWKQLKATLPDSIQSGELTPVKLKEAIVMMGGIANKKAYQEFETLLLDAFVSETTPLASKKSILSALGFFSRNNQHQLLTQSLQAHNESLIESASQQINANQWLHHLSPSTLNWFDSLVDKTHPRWVLAIRQAAYQALSNWSPQDTNSLEKWITGIKEPDNVIQTCCLNTLLQYQCKDPAVLSAYQQLIFTPEASILQLTLALKGLCLFESKTILPILTGALKQADNPEAFLCILFSLMQVDFATALPTVESVLLSTGVEVDHKLAVLRLLGKQPHPAAERILVQLLTQIPLNTDVQWMAIRSLGQMGQSKTAYQVIEKMALSETDLLFHTLKRAQSNIKQRLSHQVLEETAKSPILVMET